MKIVNKVNLNTGEEIPPGQEGKYFVEKNYSCFGFSLQGSSHMDRNIPCQDYNDFKYIKEADVIVAGIADGVGSCPLSHWGSYIAVQTAMDYTETAIRKISQGNVLRLTDIGKLSEILRHAFERAVDAVEDFAEHQNRPVSAFMSTLTLVLYDGIHLCCQHVGDDGVVVQFMDGSLEMITQRIKGEEASSVYPLQSGKEYWQFSVTRSDERGPVAAIVMATDGVLDKFVMENGAYKNVEGCCGGIYYPFMKRTVYSSDKQRNTVPRKPDEALSYYIERMNGKDYRSQVTDDLTLVSIIHPANVKKGRMPDFDKEIFNSVTQKIRKRQMEMLYPVRRVNPLPESQKNEYRNRKEVERGSNSPGMTSDHSEEDADSEYFSEKTMKWMITVCGGLLVGILIGVLFVYIHFGKTESQSNPESQKTTTQEPVELENKDTQKEEERSEEENPEEEIPEEQIPEEQIPEEQNPEEDSVDI